MADMAAVKPALVDGMTSKAVDSRLLPCIARAIASARDESQPFCILLLSDGEEADAFLKRWKTLSFLQEVCFLRQTADILRGKMSVSAAESLLAADFVIWLVPASRQVNADALEVELFELCGMTDGLFWAVVCGQGELREPTRFSNRCCHLKSELLGGGNFYTVKDFSEDRLFHCLNGMLLVERERIRPHLKRQTADYVCKAYAEKIRKELLEQRAWQAQQNRLRMVIYGKVMCICEELEHALSEDGAYIRFIGKQLERLDVPEQFRSDAKELFWSESKRFFSRWQERLSHAAPGSKACASLADALCNTVFGYAPPLPQIVGYRKKSFWEIILFRPAKPVYEDVQKRTKQEIKEKLLPLLRKQLAAICREFHAESEEQIVRCDPLWEGWLESYLKLTELSQQLPQQYMR